MQPSTNYLEQYTLTYPPIQVAGEHLLELYDLLPQLIDLQRAHQQAQGLSYEQVKQGLSMAMLDECSELIGHHKSWKWWTGERTEEVSKQTRDRMVLELSDILHFALIWLAGVDNNAIYGASHQARCAQASWIVPRAQAISRLIDIVDTNARTATPIDVYSLIVSIRVLAEQLLCPLTELVRCYVGKLALNAVRQAHGYKEGKYRKYWCVDAAGKQLEDNDVMQAYLAKEFPELSPMLGAQLETIQNGLNCIYVNKVAYGAEPRDIVWTIDNY